MLGLGLEVGLPLSAPGSTPSTLDRVVGGGRGEEAPTEAAAAAEAVEAVGAVEAEAAAAAAGAATAAPGLRRKEPTWLGLGVTVS